MVNGNQEIKTQTNADELNMAIGRLIATLSFIPTASRKTQLAIEKDIATHAGSFINEFCEARGIEPDKVKEAAVFSSQTLQTDRSIGLIQLKSTLAQLKNDARSIARECFLTFNDAGKVRNTVDFQMLRQDLS